MGYTPRDLGKRTPALPKIKPDRKIAPKSHSTERKIEPKNHKSRSVENLREQAPIN